ncbi:hypothetical protein [Labrys neptuniae]
MSKINPFGRQVYGAWEPPDMLAQARAEGERAGIEMAADLAVQGAKSAQQKGLLGIAGALEALAADVRALKIEVK